MITTGLSQIEIGLAVLVLTVTFTLTAIYFLEEPEVIESAFMLSAADTSMPFTFPTDGKPVQAKFDCVNATERERVRQIVFDGIDQGLKESMAHLFDIWQRDPDNQQPKRAQVGTTNAVNAHNRARKLAFAWNPPEC